MSAGLPAEGGAIRELIEAKCARVEVGGLKWQLLHVYAEHGPLVDDALIRLSADRVGELSPQRVRTARAGLVRAGLLRASGTGLSNRGNTSTLWELDR